MRASVGRYFKMGCAGCIIVLFVASPHFYGHMLRLDLVYPGAISAKMGIF
jgi:hypothetical protein